MIRTIIAVLSVCALTGLWHVQDAYSLHVMWMVVLGAAWGIAFMVLLAAEFSDLHKRSVSSVIAEL